MYRFLLTLIILAAIGCQQGRTGEIKPSPTPIPTPTPDPRLIRRETTEMVVVHHSATKTGDVEAFRRYHVEKRGWVDIGYHFVVLRDGTVQTGRAEWAVGAHAPERHRNWRSVGVCLVGENSFTQKQIDSLTELLDELCTRYEIVPGAETIQGHNEECPGEGISLDELIARLK